jgi:hypothetical protein
MRLHIAQFSIPAAILASLLVLAASAQIQPAVVHDPDAQDTTTTDAGSPAPALTPEQVALIERYLTQIHAQPTGKIDSRTATAGQGITLQITQDATLANGTELPKGTRLTGRILRAQSYQPEGAGALLSISIDRAILKNGSSLPVRCVLRSIVSTAAPGGNMMDASQQGSRLRRNGSGSAGGPVGGATPLGNPTPMGGSIGTDSGGMGGGGSMSGADSSGNSSVYNPSSTNSRNGNPGATSTGGTPIGDPGIGGSAGRIPMPNTTAVAATADPEKPVTAAGESIHDTPHPSGLPGVMLSGASVAGNSGTLSAYERNIALDGSTQLTLGVISAK